MIGKEEVKLPLFLDNMIFIINPNEYTKQNYQNNKFNKFEE